MADFFYSIDVWLFYLINQTISAKFLDKFFLILTDVKHWYIAYIILWSILYFKGGRLGKIAAIGSILLITVSDQFNSHFLKHLVERVRPCHVLDNVRLLVSCKSSYSFPSSHATNNFAIAFFMLRLFPKYKWILIVVASLVALSRPYVGVHYPSDIAAGAILGAGIGYLFSIAAVRIDSYLEKRNSKV